MGLCSWIFDIKRLIYSKRESFQLHQSKQWMKELINVTVKKASSKFIEYAQKYHA